MPLGAGEVAFCMQGNEMPAAFSHSAENTRYALDFAVLGNREVVVVAAAGGVVEHVVRGAVGGESNPGGGFGNLVFVRHADGWATLYAHLAEVDVEEGVEVRVGARLGLLGDTGMAGHRHVHFSLHRSSSADAMPGTSRPIDRLTSIDLTGEPGSPSRTFDGRSMVCEKARYGPLGHFYAFVAGHDVAGAVDDVELGRVIAAHFKEQSDLLAPGDGLDAILSNVERIGPLPMKAILERATKRDATYWVGWYALGIVSDQQGDFDDARRAWGVIVEPTQEKPEWLRAWAHLRLADLAIRKGDRGAARRLLDRAAPRVGYRDAEYGPLLVADRAIVLVPPAARRFPR